MPHLLHNPQLEDAYASLTGYDSNQAKRLSNDFQLIRLCEFVKRKIGKMLAEAIECGRSTEAGIASKEYLFSSQTRKQ